MERVQQVVCRGPAEPEDPVHAEEAFPKGGSRAALPVPGEHTHTGSRLQQPALPARVEPRALVSGNLKGLSLLYHTLVLEGLLTQAGELWGTGLEAE